MANLPQLSSKAATTDTRPEIELIICCARTHIDTVTAERIKLLLQQDIDWAYLIKTAHQHGVMPLLYRSLKITCPEAVPNAILYELQTHFHANALRNEFLVKELIKLLNLLEAHGIPAIPFKGPVLAASVYSNLELRQFCDLDILVHEQDVQKAKGLLISQGYRPYFPESSTQETAYLQALTGAQEAAYLQSQWEHHFVHDDSMVNVDLHQGITPKSFSFPLAPEHLWSRLKPLSLAGKTVLTFLPEDLLLILCVNGARECWEKMSRLCDVAELIRVNQEIDWQQVIEQARRLGSERMLLLGLLLAHSLLGTTLPDEVCQRIQADPVLELLVAQVNEHLFDKTDGLISASKIKSPLFHLRLRERLRDKVYYCFGLMTPSPGDWALLPLPPFLSFFYYLLRPIRLVGKYGLSNLKRFPEM